MWQIQTLCKCYILAINCNWKCEFHTYTHFTNINSKYPFVDLTFIYLKLSICNGECVEVTLKDSFQMSSLMNVNWLLCFKNLIYLVAGHNYDVNDDNSPDNSFSMYLYSSFQPSCVHLFESVKWEWSWSSGSVTVVSVLRI